MTANVAQLRPDLDPLAVDLDLSGERFRLRVRDDGRGPGDFDDATRTGAGVKLMAHRARGPGATFMLAPLASGGTLVTCVRAGRS